jgi:Zn ribbon nucleic-acid-binding protein
MKVTCSAMMEYGEVMEVKCSFKGVHPFQPSMIVLARRSALDFVDLTSEWALDDKLWWWISPSANMVEFSHCGHHCKHKMEERKEEEDIPNRKKIPLRSMLWKSITFDSLQRLE